ncbi:MAG: AraC family transcriptional regulator [Chloroflexi bacterium]|nr:AraC family transcriptional regulator [Chloroflexota bacterium]
MRPLTTSQRIALRAIQRKLTEPLCFLSSEELGWQDVLVNVFHEPLELSGWVGPVVPEVALVLMARGSMLLEYKSDDGRWKGRTYRPGHLFLKPAGRETSELRWHSISNEPMQTVHVHINNDRFCADGFGENTELIGRSGFRDPLLAQIMLALRQELEQPSQTGRLYAESATQLLAAHLLHHYIAPAALLEGPLTQEQIQCLTDFVLVHLHQKLPLELLAKQVDFSPYHFARLFRETTGESPHQFVLRQRISHAKFLLSSTGLSIAQIAVECGFANPGHLTQTFKRYVGLTPSEYRNFN